jgi:phage N-6-adenine-methyltransferase
MSLVGFKARNHPQQVRERGAKLHVDDRATPPELFEPLNERFGFTLDACAEAHNAKCARYFTPQDDGLQQDWAGERVFCNPPYSNIEPWAQKARMSVDALAVLLVPANRTEQGWWQRQVEPWREGPSPLRVEFLPGRPRFITYANGEVGPNERPPFGCALLIWGSLRDGVR